MIAFGTEKPEKMLIFDIKGPFAHFRKYYTNSSSLSYIFPPRTVVTGLLAGLLGYPNERSKSANIYYEIFNSEKCKVTVALLTRIKKFMQTVNYLATDDFPKTSQQLLIKLMNGKIGHTQIPLEILMSESETIQELCYRIYFYHHGTDIYSELKNRLLENKFVYPPYLGISEFLASIKYIAEGEVERNNIDTLEIKTVCRLDYVEPIFEGNNLQYLIEKMPTGFLNDRTPLKPENYIFDMKNRFVKVKLKNNDDSYAVSYSDKGSAINENIMFM